ncbi:glycosyltransferase family 2 protein [Burkholderia sp. BCC0405]|uniref:glycosyltransferase family 2 protein n=1 Tax=Burkholderia sp. BCC0405 TaxID=2676298 RepID=UPI00158A8316|nr:glycosyltransferase family 2 protein [Burkholderia sp. BCC0405]
MTDLSYIVPAHNVEPFIEDCLTSLIRDVGISFELIVIDDRSTDRTMEMVSEICARHPNLQLIVDSTQNYDEYRAGGLSAARNTGIRRARGRYISLIDSDDWIDARAFANAVRLLDRHGGDFAWLRSLVYNQRSGEFKPFNDKAVFDSVLNGNAFALTNIEECPQLAHFEASSCNRVYRADFLRDRVGAFPMGLIYEDVPKHFRAIAIASKILLTSAPAYFYRINRPGQITSRNDEKRLDFVRIVQAVAADSDVTSLPGTSGAQIVSHLVDFAFWCITSVAHPVRERFVGELSDAFKLFPDAWLNEVLGTNARNDDRSYKLWLILNKKARELSLYVSKKTDVRTSFRFYLDTGRREHAQLAMRRRAKTVVAGLMRRFK